MPHKDVVELIRRAVNSVTLDIISPVDDHPSVAAAQQRAVAAEDVNMKLAQERIRLEQKAVGMEQQKLSKEQEALRAEQQRVEAERQKLLDEQEHLRQQQERLRQERRQVDRTQGLVEEARAATAAAHAEKLLAEERVRKLLEEERNLREFHMEMERFRALLIETSSQLSAKRHESQRLLEECRRVASQKDLRDVLEIVGAVEAKAREDLIARQGPLPADEREHALEEKRREAENITLFLQVEDVRIQELARLLKLSEELKREKEKREEENRDKIRAGHFKDQQTLRENQQRIQKMLDDATEQKRIQEDAAAERRKQEAEARRREGLERTMRVICITHAHSNDTGTRGAASRGYDSP
jgi:hypothetical protein